MLSPRRSGNLAVMKLLRARVRNYRSIKDSGEFSVESDKTILVGTNESGKTALFRALQTLNPPDGEGQLDAFRDYPRSLYSGIDKGEVRPDRVVVAEGVFSVDDDLRSHLERLDTRFADVTEVTVTRLLGNNRWIQLGGVPASVKWSKVEKRFSRLRKRVAAIEPPTPALLAAYDDATADLADGDFLLGDPATKLTQWLTDIRSSLSDDDQSRADQLRLAADLPTKHAAARTLVAKRLPVFVYYSSITTVRPRINLALLADRIRTGELDPDIDAGNVALFKLVGLDPGELSAQGKVSTKAVTSQEDAEHAQNQLAKRLYAFQQAAKSLTTDVRAVWGEKRHKLEFRVEGDHVRVVVITGDAVDIDLDQRSAGFVWLVSFYIVFKAETQDNLANAILLLDEPGLSLHALKQQQFRDTVSLIAASNQTLYTTHSPFMVGPDELPLVRVVDLKPSGTKVHQNVTSADPASLFPLQAALGYTLAQSLFAQKKNLVCEGITDYWYIDGMRQILQAAGKASMDEDIAIVPAGGASKVVYFAVLLHAQRLKVGVLLDSDNEGEVAANEEDFVRLLGEKRIHRTGKHLVGSARSTTEDLLRETLIRIAKEELGWDVASVAAAQPTRPLVEVLKAEVPGFSKYKLANAFVRAVGKGKATDFTLQELASWESLFKAVNKSVT